MAGQSERALAERALAERVLVGAIAAPHGVRGLVKVKSFTAEPAAIAAYGPLTDEAGRRRVALQVMSAAGGGAGTLICRIDGVADRDGAAALKGLRLYVERAALPAPEEEEYYQADLIGLVAMLADGTEFGRVVAVPQVDLAGRRLTVDPPAGLLDPGGPEAAEGRDAPAGRRKGA